MKKAISGGRTLPENVIAYGVLPRLPAKTLIRLQCVSKRWRALISTDPHFMRLQDAHARSSPTLLVFGETPCPVFLSRREERDQPRSIGFPRIFRQPLFGSRHGDWLPLAACGGILCIATASSSGRTSGLYLGNPVWMDWRPLPAPPGWTPQSDATKMQLAVHDTPGGTHYKLVLPFSTQSGIAGRAEAAFLVFCSTKGSWEISQQKVLVKVPGSRREIVGVGLRCSVCVEGVFFWLAGLEVLWFDPRDERGGAIPLPLPFTDEAQLPQNIGEWEGNCHRTSVNGKGS
ncbi:uncharacterized protein LOC109721470 [Ananas comosus]|uniref:Uncharacterized protein LOC109721470 n=1 Tax=Ananas comosus TaxID=4615 RepID=A0A6P5G7Y0_ANACO|nr:uncharacterized protein LOC109721470 [Ananas comosus]